METSTDELVATLAGMGFEVDQCQAALDAGKLTVQAALDWILEGGTSSTVQTAGTGHISTRATPTLTLGAITAPVSGSQNEPHVSQSDPPGYLPFSLPPIALNPEAVPAVNEEEAVGADVVSRFHLNEAKQEDRSRWEKQQRDEDAAMYKEQRKQEKEAKLQILKEIKADREARKVKKTELPVAVKEDMKPVPHQTTQRSECMLQIRLPSGKRLRQTFDSKDTLGLVESALKKLDTNLPDIEFVQPFPPKTFSRDTHFSETLQTLGLVPSASLVARVQGEKPSSAVHPTEQKMDTNEPSQQPGRYFGALSGIDQSQRVTVEPMEVEQGDIEHRHEAGQIALPERIAPPSPRQLQRVPQYHRSPDRPPGAQIVELGMELLAGRRGAGHPFWGEGQSLRDDSIGNQLEDDIGEDERQEHEEEPSLQAAAATAAVERLKSSASKKQSQESRHAPPKPVLTLSDICFKCLVKRVVGISKQQSQYTNLEALPPNIAQRLLDEMKKSGLLRPKTLQLFLPCRLNILSLDCYKYATNELLQAACRHVHLQRLSLAACPFITDDGLLCLSSLKRLQYLNLCNNNKVTDKAFLLIANLPNLVTLVLEGTSISDVGLLMLTGSGSHTLMNLNLNRTMVTDAGTKNLCNFTNLQSLGLEKTNIKHLQNISKLSNLKSLNIARNQIEYASDLKYLHDLPKLCALNVSNIEGISGDAVLHCLNGLQLRILTLPDRHSTTDEGIKHLADMPLELLDLTDYMQITDKGVQYLAGLTSLKKLSLSNTKITDESMPIICDWTDLGDLNLDRTLLTNEGAVKLGVLSKLHDLSMADTKVSSKFMLKGALNKCASLTRLNLSRTDVTNQGVTALRLPHLTQLNLDYTRVTSNIAELLHGCPQIAVVRVNNLRSPPAYPDEDDD